MLYVAGYRCPSCRHDLCRWPVPDETVAYARGTRHRVRRANRAVGPTLSELRSVCGFTSDDLGRGSPGGSLRVSGAARTRLEEEHVFSIPVGEQARWYSAKMRRGGTQTAPEVLLFIADVTQRREAEEALKATVRELEESRRQMVMAQRMHSIGRLAGGVAHDFNNLLTVIISFTRFVMDDLGSQDPRRADLVEVLKASDSASKLTRQLLAFSSQQSSEPVLTDLNSSTSRFARVLQRTLPESIHLRIVESATPVLEDLKTPIDLLVTDIMLPGIDGMQLALRLRAAQPELRVLVCSGHAGNAHAAALTVDQRTAFLPKPFTGVELSAAAAALVE